MIVKTPNPKRSCSAMAALGLLILAGCGGGSDLYPLKVGSEWSYTVSNKFSVRVQTIKVVRRVPLAGSSGYELQGPMGLSRLAWKGNTLYASMLPNARFLQPIPMLVAGDPKAVVKWHGQLETLGNTQKADATLRQQPDTVDLGSKKYDAIRATLSVQVGGKVIELETWYARGIGPIRQEQRTGNDLNVKLELLGGP